MLNFGRKKEEEDLPRDFDAQPEAALETALQRKSFFQAALPVFACGAGLFSDGYVNNVIGSVATTLTRQYGTTYSDSTAAKYVSDIAFAGTVVGQLLFGFLSDHWSRTNSLLVSTVILIIFTALATGSYFKGSIVGMFNILTAWRFFVGIGIGGEYPAGSVGCAESSGELKKGTRNRWFILFTNTMIDWGFVLGAFIPYAAAAGTNNLSVIWRVSLGMGLVFPCILFILRLRLKEPEEFARESMKRRTPYTLVLRYYWFRLACVSVVWFLYDFSVYAFGIYSSTILAGIYPPDAPLTKIFGWNTVLNLFYIPGTMIGAFVSDWIGPRYALIFGVTAQAVVGFIMAGVYDKISKHIAAFAVVYGIFLSLGELGPGNNIGLLAAKTCATGVRGRYYGIAAAIGKIGAFTGTYAFPSLEKLAGNDTQSAQYPFWVAGALCIVSALITYFLIPQVGQDTISAEDIKFRAYLESKGWDISQLGLLDAASTPSVAEEGEFQSSVEKKI